MKFNIIKYVFVFAFFLISIKGYSQCEILNRLSPDRTMLYYMTPVNFTGQKQKSLQGNLVTDKENYFLALYPIPYPDKTHGKKLKADAEIKLKNGKNYRLSHYDTRYLENDSIMELLYLIDKRDLEDVLNFEVTEISVDMKGDEGVRKYVLKLHKKALQEQLGCFMKMND